METVNLWKQKIYNRFLSTILPKFFSHKKLNPPEIINERCPGIKLGGKLVKSIIFSTDLAIIENTHCDAVLAVYPFAPSVKVMESLIRFTDKPVICGVGGGVTKGNFSLQVALEAEKLGAAAIIVNQPFPNNDLRKLAQKVKIPIISSASNININFAARLENGADIIHITGGKENHTIIEKLKSEFPYQPFICTGGKSLADIKNAVNSGAKAVVLSPPATADLFRTLMDNYRAK